jgi:hypothetical protein
MDNPALAFLFVFLFFLIPVLLTLGPFLFLFIVSVVSKRLTARHADVVWLSLHRSGETAHSSAAGFHAGG